MHNPCSYYERLSLVLYRGGVTIDKCVAKEITNTLAEELPDIMPTGVPRSIKIVFDYGSFELSLVKEGADIERQLTERPINNIVSYVDRVFIEFSNTSNTTRMLSKILMILGLVALLCLVIFIYSNHLVF